MMNAAAPEGTPPRRIANFQKNLPVPPCLGEALRWEILVKIMIFNRKYRALSPSVVFKSVSTMTGTEKYVFPIKSGKFIRLSFPVANS
jgi:hypothetical protein